MFFDFKKGDKDLGRVTFGLFGELAPKTVQNFKTIASEGINGKTYAGTKIIRAVQRFMIQGKRFSFTLSLFKLKIEFHDFN